MSRTERSAKFAAAAQEALKAVEAKAAKREQEVAA